MNNQEWKIMPKIFNIKNVYPFFDLYSLQVSKCSGSFKNINDPYAKVCVPDVVKNINIYIKQYLIQCQELMKQSIQNGMKLVNVIVDQMQKFVKINNDGIMINVRANLKNSLIKEDLIKILIWDPSNC